jgi:uncharacterized protein (TIGR04255 family)
MAMSPAPRSARIYPNAPITEAVVDVKVAFAPETEVDKCLDELRQQLKREFPTSAPIHSFELQLGVKPDPIKAVSATGAASTEQVGWRLTNARADRVLQIQRRGFTFSHLPKYSNWETFEQECRPLWDSFVRVCTPTSVARLALRYINKIVIPRAQFDPREYFFIYPEMPEVVQGGVSGLFMQVQLDQPNIGEGVVAGIAVALLRSDQPKETPVLLDIDIFTERQSDPSDDAVWTALRKFRERKNFLFESFITDATRRLFE